MLEGIINRDCPLDVYLHMPKTGGKSFEEILIKNYRIENCIRIYRPGQKQKIATVLKKIPLEKKKNAALMYGHIPHECGEKLVEAVVTLQC